MKKLIKNGLSLILAASVGFGGGLLSRTVDMPDKTETAYVQSASNGYTQVNTGKSLSELFTNQTPTTVAGVAASAAPSVVEIVTEVVSTGWYMQQYISEGAGSGVIVSSDGYIVTNNHVINGATKIRVTLNNGTDYDATLVGTDPGTDIAIVKIQADNLSPAVMGDSSKLVVGETAIAIGNPLGQLGGTVTDGIISALDREITIDNETMTLLQTNAAINPGNSGGGLFNSSGELIGIVNAKSSGSDIEGLGFAIPVNTASPVIKDIISYGYVRGRVDMGVSFVDVNSSQAAWMYRVAYLGVYVSKVAENSNAAKANLRPGDLVLAVDNTTVSSESDIRKLVDKKSVGDKVTLTISRNREKQDVSFVLAEYNPA